MIPPCTPLQMVSESPAGRTVELLAVGPGWDRIKVKAKALEVDRFDDLSECVRAGDYYNRRYPAEVLDGFDGSELVFGMPVEFALMALGPPDKVSWNGWEKKSAYRWGPASSPGLHYSKLQSVSVERLFNAPNVVIEEIDPDSVSRLKRILEETTGQKDPLVTAGIVGIHVWELELAQTEQNDALLKAPPRDQSEFRLLYDQGLDLYEQGDHAGAFSMWLALAEDGYAVAQYSVGDLYYRAE
ncbi:MAG: hypothetical protein GTO30_05965, partial [Acidobacteria bacterium]|nr:hypothetical protein [Acidobacteriota bacterium]NIQ83581.1 hypothetical protein [Acidobacteriota bacterium]